MSDPETQPAADPLLTSFLDREHAACPVCGYDVNRLNASRCPECGSRLALALAAPDSTWGPWLFAVCSFSLALGFDGVVATLLSAVAIFFERPKTGAERLMFGIVWGTFFTLSLLMLGGIFGLVRNRRRWRMLPRRTQRAWAGLLFVAVGLLHVFVAVMLTAGMH